MLLPEHGRFVGVRSTPFVSKNHYLGLGRVWKNELNEELQIARGADGNDAAKVLVSAIDSIGANRKKYYEIPRTGPVP